ncbi:MAG: toxin-antitoxin system HicB family antitoxin [Pseudomonadota bacterium]
MKISDQYAKIVAWSEEDQCYIGSAPEFTGPCCHGDNEIQVYQELCTIVEEWIDIYQEQGLTLPESTFSNETIENRLLNVPQDIYQALVNKAVASGQHVQACL